MLFVGAAMIQVLFGIVNTNDTGKIKNSIILHIKSLAPRRESLSLVPPHSNPLPHTNVVERGIQQRNV
jgi:hypothetical protein